MDSSIVQSTADEVRALIAYLALGPPPDETVAGNVQLTPHQAEAVARVRDIIAEFRGALLCDVVGTGKTYIALAVARSYRNRLIVAPAALREMWNGAMTDTHAGARFVSAESLSRGAPVIGDVDFIIVDEAHHFRNQNTRRFRSLSEIADRRPVLLLTATPIHNSRQDLNVLASLFLGSRAAALSESELARIVVRRERARLISAIRLPAVIEMAPLSSADDPDLAQEMLSLPPPVPFRGAGHAESLVAHGLIRQWASSEAALAAAVKRRIARALVLKTALEAGEYPSVGEMTSWIAGDDAVQLGFPGFFGFDTSCSHSDLLPAVRAHERALRALSTRISGALDSHKSEQLRRLAIAHAGERIVAFASYDATVSEMFRRLKAACRVAALTSRGASIAGGRITRSEIISQFSPSSRAIAPAERIDLLLTTDILSEGINLQRAASIVHLDIPWTFARMEQRVGRLARAGSPHETIRVFTFSPPASAEEVIRATSIVAAKRETAGKVVGRNDDSDGLAGTQSPPEQNEALRAMLAKWRAGSPLLNDDRTLVSAAFTARAGFLAVVSFDWGSLLLGSDGSPPSDSIEIVHKTVSCAHGSEAELDPVAVRSAIASVQEWINARASSESAGLNIHHSRRGRRKLLARIDSIATRMSPHERAVRAPLIMRARQSAASSQGAWGEKQIESLAKTSDGSGASWLEQITQLGEVDAPRQASTERCRIRALLLLVEPTPAPSS